MANSPHETETFTFSRRSACDLSFNIVNTPGFNGLKKTDIEITMGLASIFEITFCSQFMVSGVVFMHKITDARFEASILMNLRYWRKAEG